MIPDPSVNENGIYSPETASSFPLILPSTDSSFGVLPELYTQVSFPYPFTVQFLKEQSRKLKRQKSFLSTDSPHFRVPVWRHISCGVCVCVCRAMEDQTRNPFSSAFCFHQWPAKCLWETHKRTQRQELSCVIYSHNVGFLPFNFCIYRHCLPHD